MTILPTALPGPDPQTIHARIAVDVLADRPSLERLADVLDAEDRLVVRTVVSSTTAADVNTDSDANAAPDAFDIDRDRLEDVECLVLPATVVGQAGDDILDRVRRRAPDLPVVLLTDADEDVQTTSAVADAVRSQRWTDHVAIDGRGETAAEGERLGRRIRELVERRRLAALSSRSLASVELAQDAIAIVGPDDAVEFANRWYAMQFGYDRSTLPGTTWQEFFTAATVDRLETTAISTVADGWRWTGICTGRRRSGETFPARVRLGGLADGSLVFVVEELPDDDAVDEDVAGTEGES